VLVLRIRGLSIAFAALVTASSAGAEERQRVLISFDGAHDNAQWDRSLALSERTGAKFTYFLTCAFLLSPETKHVYLNPEGRRGRTNVGVGKSKADVAARLGHIWQAQHAGHEIANHTCGHLDGSKWTKAQWQQEFASFNRILRDAWIINGIDGEPEGWRQFVRTGISGFRAPYLATSPSMYRTLLAAGYAYDASAISRGPVHPESVLGLTRFALPLIAEGPQQRPVIAMDYNLFARHTRTKETPDTDGVYEQRAYNAFMAAFRREHEGKRRPVQIGLHFTLMNDGAYWRAVERFAADVCKIPDVDCISYQMAMEKPTAAVKPVSGTQLRGATN
jgi:peptidoglycan/xylan/chitin deacetylase (PgdA/CDA1 family)